MRGRLWNIIVAAATLAALGAIYGGLVVHDPVLTRDDRSLLGPLWNVHNLSDYLQARAHHQIFDLQPLRDASFLLDMKLGQWLGHGTFHATNLVLWLVIVALSFALMRLVHGDSPWLAPAVAVFAVHPVFVGSVAWISARKHLLSCLFIVAATLVFERMRRHGGGWGTGTLVVVLYLASTLSQPITALWPLWAALTLALKPGDRRPLWTVAVAMVVMIGVLGANYAYYTGDYVQRTAVAKFEEPPGVHGVALRAIGRYVGDFVWPTRLATTYDPGASIEIVGLVALVVIAILLLVAARWQDVLIWGAFLFFPLVMVTARMTNVYVSDTYALTSGIGLLSLALLLLNALARRWTPIILVLLFVVLIPLSIAQARTWSSDAALWEQAWRVSPTPTTTARHAYFLLHSGRTADARTLLEAIPREDRQGDVAQVYGQLIYTSELPLDEKARRLSLERASPWRDYYLAASEAGLGQFPAAWALMRAAFEGHPHFGEDLPVVIAESEFFCERAGGSDCAAWVDSQWQRLGGWDEQRFEARRAQLR